jgi:glycosidase
MSTTDRQKNEIIPRRIHREAVLHIPLSHYAFAISEDTVVLRLRVAKNNISKCTLCYGDRAYMPNPVPFFSIQMEFACNDLYYDYYEVHLTPGFERICYAFLLEAADEKLFYCADLFLKDRPYERSEYYQYPFIRREEISDVPEWFKRAVVYNIFPDSFASGLREIADLSGSKNNGTLSPSQSRHGGTIRGITENLDYITKMGFNCLYLNPIFVAGEYHKYDTIDYFHIDPCFGSDEDFRELINMAHSQNIAIILDGVFNHCSWYFFAFDDVVRNGKYSQYADWFYDLEFPVIRPDGENVAPNYASFAYERTMPKLNSSHPDVRAYFMDVCRHWIRDYGIDGWRLDVANEVDRAFWREFCHVARQENPNCIFIAEIWESAESWLKGDMFDSTMNYDFRKNCRDFFANNILDATEFDARATMMRMRYPTGILQGQLNLLDSHDVSRFITLCEDDERRLRLAILFQMAFPGVPGVFYGDELGLDGVNEPDYRKAMPWDKTNTDLYDFYVSAISLREHEEIIYGDYHTLSAEKNSSLYVFERRLKNEALIIALNPGEVSTILYPPKIPDDTPLMTYNYQNGILGGYGYVVWKETDATL